MCAVAPPKDFQLWIENTVFNLQLTESEDVKPRNTKAKCVFIEKKICV